MNSTTQVLVVVVLPSNQLTALHLRQFAIPYYEVLSTKALLGLHRFWKMNLFEHYP
jgi:hypothetical protein